MIFRRCRVRFILDIGVAAATAVAVSSCCDDSSGPVVVATESVGGLSFLRVQLVGLLFGEARTRLVAVLKLRLFFCVGNVGLRVIYMFVVA